MLLSILGTSRHACLGNLTLLGGECRGHGLVEDGAENIGGIVERKLRHHHGIIRTLDHSTR